MNSNAAHIESPAERRTVSILGSGWLGLPLIRRLASEGFTVRASTRSPGRLDLLGSAGAEPHCLDLSQPSAKTGPFFDSDTLIINIPSRDAEEFARLTAALENAPVRQVLYVSTTSVYPNLDRTQVDWRN